MGARHYDSQLFNPFYKETIIKFMFENSAKEGGPTPSMSYGKSTTVFNV
jgi:hypothetical protein